MNQSVRSAPRLFSFGPFVADPLRGTLRKSGALVALTPKAFEVLVVFLQRPGEILEKDELLKLAWPNTIVEENNLARHVSTLRKVFDDHSSDHQYIVTVPGRGYRFVAQVHQISDKPQVTEAPIPPAPSQPLVEARRHRFQVIAVAALVVLAATALGGAIFVLRSSAAEMSAERRLSQLTFDSGLQNEPSWSPDGKRIAYASDRTGNFDIWTEIVGQGNPVRLTSSRDQDWQPAWSPDGRRIAFRSEREGGGIFLVNADGANEQQLTNFGFIPRWSPDGSKILFSRMLEPTEREASGIYVIDSNGGDPQPLLQRVVEGLNGFRASWHPNGDRISVFGGRSDSVWRFWTATVDGRSVVESRMDPGVARKLHEAGVRLRNFVWSPRGDALYFEGTSQGVQNLWRVRVDPTTLTWTDGPERLTVGTSLDGGISLSSDGRRLAFNSRTERTRLWSFPFDGIAGRITGPGEPVDAEVADASYDALVRRETARLQNQSRRQTGIVDASARRRPGSIAARRHVDQRAAMVAGRDASDIPA